MKKILLLLCIFICIPFVFADNISISTNIALYKTETNLTLYYEGGYYSINLSQYNITNFTHNINFNRSFDSVTVVDCDINNLTIFDDYVKCNTLSEERFGVNKELSLKLASCDETLNPKCYNQSQMYETCKTNLDGKDNEISICKNNLATKETELQDTKSSRTWYAIIPAGLLLLYYFLVEKKKKEAKRTPEEEEYPDSQFSKDEIPEEFRRTK